MVLFLMFDFIPQMSIPKMSDWCQLGDSVLHWRTFNLSFVSMLEKTVSIPTEGSTRKSLYWLWFKNEIVFTSRCCSTSFQATISTNSPWFVYFKVSCDVVACKMHLLKCVFLLICRWLLSERPSSVHPPVHMS